MFKGQNTIQYLDNVINFDSLKVLTDIMFYIIKIIKYVIYSETYWIKSELIQDKKWLNAR